MSTSEAITVGPGKIRFYSHFRPALSAGEYRVRTEQELDFTDLVDQPGQAPKLFTHEQNFHVDAPRFRLGPGDLHAVYPPANSEGNFDQTLPHAVLRKRALPWERTLDGDLHDPEAPRPWMALLVFHGGEAPEVAARPIAKVAAQATNPRRGIFRPEITLSDLDQGEIASSGPEDLGPRASMMDISRDIFLRIAPGLADLEHLAHVRQVNTGDKELLGLEADGWFSVVLTNRLPKAGLNTVHLVSLEGLQDYLPGGVKPLPTAVTHVRMVSLASWSFTARPARGSFKEIMEDLDVGLLRVPVPDELRAAAEDPEAALVTAALDAGYSVLDYDMRHGETTAGWYRGPLLPVVVERRVKDPFPSAEAGLIYDPRLGMFDVSHAVAWQIGRLLALADAHFATALGQWRQEGHRLLDRMIDQAQVALRYAEIELLTTLGSVLEAPEETREDKVLELLTDLFDSNLLGRRLAAFVRQEIAPGTDDTVLLPAPEAKERLLGGLPTYGEVRGDEIEALAPGLERAEWIRDRLLSNPGER